MTLFQGVRGGKSALVHFGGVTSAYVRRGPAAAEGTTGVMVLFCLGLRGRQEMLQRCLFCSALGTHASMKPRIILPQNLSWVA